jgi:hypothetical protein
MKIRDKPIWSKAILNHPLNRVFQQAAPGNDWSIEQSYDQDRPSN